MKILLFTDSDAFAGTERHILDIAGGLREESCAAVIACPGESPLAVRARAAGFSVHPIEKRGAIDLVAIRKIAGLLASGEIDVVHAHNGRSALIAALARCLAGRGKFLYTQHFLSTARERRRGPSRRASQAAHRWVSRQAARIIAISEAVKLSIEARGDAPSSKIVVAPNGIPDPLEESLIPSAEVRRSLGIGTDTPLVVAAARLQPEKGIEHLIDAMVLVNRHLPAARCVIAGEGVLKDALEERIKGAAMSGVVQLLGFRPDVLSIMRAADVFVMPSLAEPFGLALVEAMGLERAVVATSAGGPLEIVCHDQTGFLVPPEDVPAISEAILTLLLSPERAEIFGLQGRKRYIQHFTVRRMAARLAEIYGEESTSQKSKNPVIVG